MSHGDQITSLPHGFTVLAKTASCPYAGVENQKLKLYGVQFHPEVMHTIHGSQILKNFVFGICHAKKDFSLEGLSHKLILEVKEIVGGSSVIMGTSGGVDSTVAATLIHSAIGERLHCVFIDTGLIRKREAEEVKQFFRRLHFHHFHTTSLTKYNYNNTKRRYAGIQGKVHSDL